MAAPTLASSGQSAWNTTGTSKTASVTLGAGDVLVVKASVENTNVTLSTPTGGGLTWTLRQAYTTANYSPIYVWTASSSSAQTFTLSVGASGTSATWGFAWEVWSGSGGVGASTKGQASSGAPSLAITTTGASSALSVLSSDWNAVTGTRTYRTVNGFTPTAGGSGESGAYPGDGSSYGAYSSYYPNAGTASAQTVGMTAPTGQKYNIAAVEILAGAASSDAGTVSATLPKLTGAISGTARNAAVLAASVPLVVASISGTATDPGSVQAHTPSLTGAVAGGSRNTGALSASTPLLTAQISDQTRNAATLSAHLPLLVSATSGTSTNPGAVSAALLVPVSTIAGTSTDPASIAAALPTVTGALSGTATNPGALSASTPLPTARLVDSSIKAPPSQTRAVPASDRTRAVAPSTRVRVVPASDRTITLGGPS